MFIEELERRLAFAITAADDSYSVTEGSTSTGDLNTNDTPTSSTLKEITFGTTTSSVTSGGTSIAGAYGTLVVKADGTFTYTPNGSLAAGVVATDTFTYKAEARISGTLYSDTADVTFTVTGANGAPVTVADTGSTNEDTAVTVNVVVKRHGP